MIWTDVATLIAAVAGLVGSLWAIKKGQREEARTVRRDDLEELRTLINEIQEDRKSIKEDRDTLQTRVDELETRDSQLTHEIRELRHAKIVLTQRVQELITENRKLHETIGELRERINRRRSTDPAAIAMMQQIPSMVHETISCENEDVKKRLEALLHTVEAIQSLLNGKGGPKEDSR